MASTLGTFYEFFAGAGMARADRDQWRVFANDFDQKSRTYRLNWDDDNLLCATWERDDH